VAAPLCAAVSYPGCSWHRRSTTGCSWAEGSEGISQRPVLPERVIGPEGQWGRAAVLEAGVFGHRSGHCQSDAAARDLAGPEQGAISQQRSLETARAGKSKQKIVPFSGRLRPAAVQAMGERQLGQGQGRDLRPQLRSPARRNHRSLRPPPPQRAPFPDHHHQPSRRLLPLRPGRWAPITGSTDEARGAAPPEAGQLACVEV